MAVIVYDLDGRLVDTVPDLHAAVTLMLADDQAPPMDMSQIGSITGNDVPALISKVMAAQGKDPAHPMHHPQMEAKVMQHHTAAPADRSQLFPGLLMACRTFRQAGHALALCTNKPVIPSRAILDSFDLSSLLPILIGEDSLPVRKPDQLPQVSGNAMAEIIQAWLGVLVRSCHLQSHGVTPRCITNANLNP